MLYTIYETTNLVNGKTYIGKHQTVDPNDSYMGSGLNIRRAFEKYGLEWFDKTVLYVFETEEEMNAKEKEIVTPEYCALSSNYNICPGGQGGFGYINSNGLKSRLNVGQIGKEFRDKNPEARDTFSLEISLRNKKNHALGKMNTQGLNWNGRNHSEDSKRKISSSMLGKNDGSKNSQFGTIWITNGIDKPMKISNLLPIPEGWRRGRK